MKTRAIREILFFVALAALASSRAVSAGELRWLVKGGVDFGGDTIQTVPFTDGSTSSIKANEGVYLAGGGAYVSDAHDFESHLSIGWKYTSVTASNGDVTFTRYPIEWLFFYNLDTVRVGGGPAYHLNPKLKGSGAASNIETTYDNAFGLILQGDYRFTDNFAIGLRYTVLKYKATDASDAQANGLGITVSGTF